MELPKNTSKAAIASCPAGKQVLGGGAWVSNSVGNGGPALVRSVPSSDLTMWVAFAAETGSYANSWQVFAIAICAKVAS